MGFTNIHQCLTAIRAHPTGWVKGNGKPPKKQRITLSEFQFIPDNVRRESINRISRISQRGGEGGGDKRGGEKGGGERGGKRGGRRRRAKADAKGFMAMLPCSCAMEKYGAKILPKGGPDPKASPLNTPLLSTDLN